MSLRQAAEAACATLDYAASVADRPGLMGMCEKAAEILRAALAEAGEPVAWAGYNLDRMADAFARVIDAHDGRNGPFLNPVIMDADLALREFRTIIRRTKTYTHPPHREPLTEIGELVLRKFTSMNGIPVERCTVKSSEVDEIRLAHGIGTDE